MKYHRFTHPSFIYLFIYLVGFFLHEVSREEKLFLKAIASVASGEGPRLSVPSWP